ncbi:MAG: hypothetical protein M3R17_09450 [Bacteroidota bacterium]|nr:hypothetical protein [Bacteroidota bacterium]
MNQQGHLEIAKPCHENWDAMAQQEQGRHCSVCCKTVMDFTAMPTEKVIEIISRKKDTNICGRFRPDQLNGNQPAGKSTRNRYRVFMAALYFVFGGLLFTSCRTKQPTHKMGRVKIENSLIQKNNFKSNLDTPSSRTLPKVDQPKKAMPVCTTPDISATDTIGSEIMMLGEIMYIPDDTTKK